MKTEIKKAEVVKIDSSLLKDVEELIKKEEHKFKFANKKQFIDLAVHEFLKKIKNKTQKEAK